MLAHAPQDNRQTSVSTDEHEQKFDAVSSGIRDYAALIYTK